MMYNDRVTIYTYVEREDDLGSPIRERVPKVVPCSRGKLTHNQQMGIFGKYDLSAIQLNLQGKYDDVDEVKYGGVIRSVRALIQHKNAMVIII